MVTRRRKTLEDILIPPIQTLEGMRELRQAYLDMNPKNGKNLPIIQDHARHCYREDLVERGYALVEDLGLPEVQPQDVNVLMHRADGLMRTERWSYRDAEKRAFYLEHPGYFDSFTLERLEWLWEFFWCMKFWGMREADYGLYHRVAGALPTWWPDNLPWQHIMTWIRSKTLRDREREVRAAAKLGA